MVTLDKQIHKENEMTTSEILKKLGSIGINNIISTMVAHDFEYAKSESEFVEALTNLMAENGWEKQEDLFPGDPCGGDENAYYIMVGKWDFYISFNDKQISHFVETM